MAKKAPETIPQLAELMLSGFDTLNARFDDVDRRLDGLDKKVDDVLDGGVSTVQKQADFETRLDAFERELAKLRRQMI